jgi:hypothetical protein
VRTLCRHSLIGKDLSILISFSLAKGSQLQLRSSDVAAPSMSFFVRFGKFASANTRSDAQGDRL